MLRSTLNKNCSWFIPQSLLAACQLQCVPGEAARLTHRWVEVGPFHLEPDQLPMPLTPKLRARFFAFLVHVHSSTRSCADQYAALKEKSLPDAQWLEYVMQWKRAPMRVTEHVRWQHDNMARALYIEFENYVRLMDHLFAWHAVSKQRKSHKLPAEAKQLRWFKGTHKALMRDFCKDRQLSREKQSWLNLKKSTPRTRFICNYFAAIFHERLLRDREDCVMLDSIRWIIGYSKLA